MREKKRWMLLRIQAEEKLAAADARLAVNEALFSFLGEVGAAKAQARVHEFDQAQQAMLMRCSLHSLEEVIAALMLKRFFHAKPITLRLQKLAGSAGSVWPPTMRA